MIHGDSSRFRVLKLKISSGLAVSNADSLYTHLGSDLGVSLHITCETPDLLIPEIWSFFPMIDLGS